MASKCKALCVGINVFKQRPDATLQGCVNDARDMTGILKDFLGFGDADITTLTDAQATKASIMSNLQSMVADAKAGKLNYLVFSMSSHGTQVPDTSGDEPDQADEAFCPHDLDVKGNQWDPDHVIIDDELHDLFAQLPKTVLLEVYLDTCHSGTGLRAIDLLPDRKPRYLPPPSLKAFQELEGCRSRGLHQALLEKGITHHILWAACRPDQTSADANIAGGWHGAFTYFLVKELRAGGNQLSRKDLLKKVRANLKAGHYTQTPQLECEATVKRSRLSPPAI
jgi:metacaspase-1